MTDDLRPVRQCDKQWKQQRVVFPVNALSESRSRVLWWVFLAGLAFVVLNALRSLPQISSLFLSADGDDQMRLVEVRDWLAGQSWFDLRQYRVLPPDGISLHWSRYVDAGIASILVPAGWLMPQTQAELLTLILWPSLLATLMVLVITQGTGRLFGAAAAIGALTVLFGWSKLGGEFVAPRIDHHNLQILGCTAVFYLSLVPGRSLRLGILAGLVMAATLAVGLEMLPVLATIWIVAALRHAIGQPQVGRWLQGFGPAFLVAAPLLLIGQTPAAEWLVPHCDELAPPVIVLGAIGTLATLVPVLAGQVLRGAPVRILVMVVIAGIGLVLSRPLLGQCLGGPFVAVDPAVRQIIDQTIVEAMSMRTLLHANPDLLLHVLLPPVVIGLLALGTAWRLRARLAPVQVAALVQAFAVLGMGLIFATVQIRAANLMTPAVPLLAGFLFQAFLQIPRTSPIRIPAVIALLLAQPAVLERLSLPRAAPAPNLSEAAATISGAAPDALGCRTPQAIARIAGLPTSILFSTLNLGPTILAFTPHSITSAGYHRSADAFWNGVGAFQTQDALRDALKKSRADYLLLCAGGAVEASSPLVQTILAGQGPQWLREMPGDSGAIRIYGVDKAALQTAAAP